MTTWPSCAALALLPALAAIADGTHTQGLWRTRFGHDAALGLPSAHIAFPTTSTAGNFLVVSYQLAPTATCEVASFTADGFWRLVRQGAAWGTSCRLFRYFSSSNDLPRDRCTVTSWVVTVSSAGEWVLELDARNDSADGDRFAIRLDAVLEPPLPHETRMRCDLVVSNLSGRAVPPPHEHHRPLHEQWRLLGLSSMYVADHLTPLPPWYDTFDPSHRYVGITNDVTTTNDAWTPRFGRTVSSHDLKWIFTDKGALELDHSTSACPVLIAAPYYWWYTQLVFRAMTSATVAVRHAVDPARAHFLDCRLAGGLVALTSLNWAATFNRWDTNMVDGDNLQISIGLDDALPSWPAEGAQSLAFDVVAGQPAPRLISLSPQGTNLVLSWVHPPGSTVTVVSATSLSATNWQVLAGATTNRSLLTPEPSGPFFRIHTP
jgi:hypothetical protein